MSTVIGFRRHAVIDMGRLARSRHRAVDIGFVCLPAALTIIALLAPVIAPYNPVQPVGGLDLSPFSPHHLLGTDSIGRDLFSRAIIGVRTSWLSALIVVLVGLLIGGLVGLIAGAFGGWVDAVLMRLTDLFLALPGALVAIAIVAALGPGLFHTLVGVSIVWWPYYARIIRGEVRALAARPHVEAARLAGVGRTRLLVRHLLPGAVPTAIVSASLDVGNVVLLLAGLSFLGLGQVQPAPELGADTANTLDQFVGNPWVPIIPGVAVLVLTLIANLGGDAIRRLLAGKR